MAHCKSNESLKALYAVTVTQGGYFTATHAAAGGYHYTHLVYHFQAGN